MTADGRTEATRAAEATREAVLAVTEAVWGFQPPPASAGMGRNAVVLESAVAGMKGSPTAIAAFFYTLQIRGIPGISGNCPLSIFLSAMTGLEVEAGTQCITVDTAHWHIRMDTPQNLRDFLCGFRDGEFPYLYVDGEVPPEVVEAALLALDSYTPHVGESTHD